jgi:hypothetical protein
MRLKHAIVVGVLNDNGLSYAILSFFGKVAGCTMLHRTARSLDRKDHE